MGIVFEFGRYEEYNLIGNIIFLVIFGIINTIVMLSPKYDPKNRIPVYKSYLGFFFINLAFLIFEVYFEIFNNRNIANSLINFIGRTSSVFICLLFSDLILKSIN